MTSPSLDKSSESARARLRLCLERSAELTKCFQDFHSLLDKLLSTSSPGSQGVPVSSLPPSDTAPI